MEARVRLSPIVGLITAESLSLLGNQIAAVAIPILVLQFTGSPLVTGIASTGNIIPVIVAAMLGGRAIDRFGAWNISIFSDVLSFFSVLALPLAFTYINELSPLLIFLLVLVGALFDPTGVSARQTLVPSLTKKSGIPLHKINSWRGGLENGADFLGPVIGVALIGILGVVNTFYINAFTFLISAVIFLVVVPRKRKITSVANQNSFRAGVDFILKHPSLRALALAGMVTGFVILPFLGLLLPVLATQKFENTTLLGICLSVFGLAATLGAACFSLLARRFSPMLIYYGGLLVTGVAMFCCALATREYEVMLSVGLAGLLIGAGNPLQQTIMQEETPAHIAGEIFTALAAMQYVAGPLGLVLAGIATEFSGLALTLYLAGGILLTTAMLGWFWLPIHKTLPMEL